MSFGASSSPCGSYNRKRKLLDGSINLKFDGVRKLEHPAETHADSGRMCEPYMEGTWNSPG